MSNERDQAASPSHSVSSPVKQIAAASAIAATGIAATSASSMAAHPGCDDTIKIALIGCGSRGAGAAAQALCTKGSVKLWAMADAFKNRLDLCLRGIKREIADKLGDEQVAKKLEIPVERQFIGLDAFRHAIDAVDVVLLCEPPGYRPLHFKYAVNAGKPVFMEKPVATDPSGIRRILAAGEEAKKKGLQVSVGLQRRHQPCYLEAIKRIQDGSIGEIAALRCYWNTAAPAKAPFDRGDLSELEYQVRNWYFFTWLSGDHICEQHVHNLDVCNWIKNAHPVEAQGLGGRQVRTGKEYGNIFDHHDVEFTYADGTKLFSQCRQIPGCWNQVAEAVIGTHGTADLNATGASIFATGKSKWRSKRERNNAVAYQTEHDVLFDAIRNNKPHNEVEYAATSTMTAILGRMATYSGKIVKWDEAFNSTHSLTTDAEDWNAPAPVTPNPDGRYAVAIPGKTNVV